jgi:hypothetical protein
MILILGIINSVLNSGAGQSQALFLLVVEDTSKRSSFVLFYGRY